MVAYKDFLPYETEEPHEEQKTLKEIIRLLCIFVDVKNWKLVTHCVDKLEKCLELKFNLTEFQRAELVFEEAVRTEDTKKIKGSIVPLISGRLGREVRHDPDYLPRLVEAIVKACEVDNIDLHYLHSNAEIWLANFINKHSNEVYFNVSTFEIYEKDQETQTFAKKSQRELNKRRKQLEEAKRRLVDVLISMVKSGEGVKRWRTELFVAKFLLMFGISFKTLASKELARLVTDGTVNTINRLRQPYSFVLYNILLLVKRRAECHHSERKHVQNQISVPGAIKIKYDGNMRRFLESFSKQAKDHFIDDSHDGWLFWGPTYRAQKCNITTTLKSKEIDNDVLGNIGSRVDRRWIQTFFRYMLEEPITSSTLPPECRLDLRNNCLLSLLFELLLKGRCDLSFKALKDEIKSAYGDGTTEHQHRMLAETYLALTSAVHSSSKQLWAQIWDYIMPKLRLIFEEDLSAEKLSYWLQFVRRLFWRKDPRRSWPLLQFISGFRLDMTSSAIKDSVKLELLRACIEESGWHFQLEEPIVNNLIDHLDHRYKAVRDIIGSILATIHLTRFHESYSCPSSFMIDQSRLSSLGRRSWQATDELSSAMIVAFGELENLRQRREEWRENHEPDQKDPFSYIKTGQTLLTWLKQILSSEGCTLPLPFVAKYMLKPVLRMADEKEDEEIEKSANAVLRQIQNVPWRGGDDAGLLNGLINIGRDLSTSRLQRQHVLIFVKNISSQQLFLLNDTQWQVLVDFVSDMLEVKQVELRDSAIFALSSVICGSRFPVKPLIERFFSLLHKSPQRDRTHKLRHTGIEGLVAVLLAFFHDISLPTWYPDLVTAVAKSVGNGSAGHTAKMFVAGFIVTRRENWHKLFDENQINVIENCQYSSAYL